MHEYGPTICKRDPKTGLYVVWTPILGLFSKGIWSQGQTAEEAQRSMDSAVGLYLKHRSLRRGPPVN